MSVFLLKDFGNAKELLVHFSLWPLQGSVRVHNFPKLSHVHCSFSTLPHTWLLPLIVGHIRGIRVPKTVQIWLLSVDPVHQVVF